MRKINILIDGFSNSVIAKSTGRTLKTIFIPANQLTINKLRKINGRDFN
jgi:transcription initiation factor TFIID subunit TAF12